MQAGSRCVWIWHCVPHFFWILKAGCMHAAILGHKTAGEADIRPLHNNTEPSSGSCGAIRIMSPRSLSLRTRSLFLCHGFKATTNLTQKAFKCVLYSRMTKQITRTSSRLARPPPWSHTWGTTQQLKLCRSRSLAVRTHRCTRYLSWLVRFSKSQNRPLMHSLQKKGVLKPKKLPFETFK